MTNDNGMSGPNESRLADLNDQLQEVRDNLRDVDDFDLRSEDQESCREWARLILAYVKSTLTLIDIVKNDEEEIRRQLQFSIDSAQELLDEFKSQT